MSAFTILEKNKHDHYFPTDQPTLGKAIAGGIKSIYLDYPGGINKGIILQVLSTILDYSNSIPAKIKEMKANAKNQLEVDLWFGLDDVLQAYAAARVDEWLRVFKNLLKAVEDDTIDGTEGDEEQKKTKTSA